MLHCLSSPIWLVITFLLDLFFTLFNCLGCGGSSLPNVGFSLVAMSRATFRCGALAFLVVEHGL